MTRTQTFRAAMLAELAAAGAWSARDVFAFARANGGSEATYAALAWAVSRGRVAYAPNVWTFVR